MFDPAALLLALAAAPPAPPSARPDDGLPLAEAPDGARGLGTGLDPERIRRAMRDPSPEDAEFLDGLRELARDVEVLAAIAAARYEALGYFSLVDDPAAALERDVEALHRDFRAQERRALRIALGEERGLALARAMADPYFLARTKVLVGTGFDVRQLRSALAVLVVHTHGRAELRGGAELNELTTRLDLAAARLRAARLDLLSLEQPATPGRHDDSPDVLRLARALARGGGGEGNTLMRTVRAEAREQEKSLLNGHLAAFDREHRAALLRREERTRVAIRNYGEMLRILPLLPDGRLPTDLEGKNSERYRQAADTGLEAALHDPLSADVQYMLGLSFDFFAGRELSLPRLDRYLALRGIRHWDHRTFQARNLSIQEEWALYVVAGWTPPKDG